MYNAKQLPCFLNGKTVEKAKHPSLSPCSCLLKIAAILRLLCIFFNKKKGWKKVAESRLSQTQGQRTFFSPMGEKAKALDRAWRRVDVTCLYRDICRTAFGPEGSLLLCEAMYSFSQRVTRIQWNLCILVTVIPSLHLSVEHKQGLKGNTLWSRPFAPWVLLSFLWHVR